jgi:hypothetical protein
MTQDEIIESTLTFIEGERTDHPAILRWERYVKDVERGLGISDLDGSDDREGYSLDACHDYFTDHLSVDETVAEFRWFMGRRTLGSMLLGDHIDARAMAAIEVHNERQRRFGGGHLTPTERVTIFGDSRLRHAMESVNGEPLL